MAVTRRRVVVTGLGIVSPFGDGTAAFWDAIVAGEAGIRHVEVEGVGTIPAGVVDEADAARARFGAREARRMSRAGRIAAQAAAEALEDAGLGAASHDGMGTSVGCVHGGPDAWYAGHEALRTRGADRVGPLTVPLGLTNSAAAAAARALGLTGPSQSHATACAAGSDAIGAALGMIRDGRARVMVAGGAEAAVSPVVVAGYATLGALAGAGRPAHEASRPFDARRDGFVIAEGAGMLVLEDLEHAEARGAPVYAELAGFGSSCDAGHLTDPDPDGVGARRAIDAALADAGVAAADVGYVNAHATSTPAGDATEARALAVAGITAPVSSTKGAHGHTLGAAGGVEAVATVLAMSRGVLPPTVNLVDPDPEAHADHVTEARALPVSVALSNSFGFGGHNAALVFLAVPGT
ncbi:MAG: beta-ketoacyl-[acyl-carrier-protein] synthase family protein [Thermoleophilia bacterium]|nr:beta-ketoacyl-[acyl-carrier-protein] synthase family protein [Thermoleophilia bacterium]